MLNVRLAGGHLYGKKLFNWLYTKNSAVSIDRAREKLMSKRMVERCFIAKTIKHQFGVDDYVKLL